MVSNLHEIRNKLTGNSEWLSKWFSSMHFRLTPSFWVSGKEWIDFFDDREDEGSSESGVFGMIRIVVSPSGIIFVAPQVFWGNSAWVELGPATSNAVSVDLADICREGRLGLLNCCWVKVASSLSSFWFHGWEVWICHVLVDKAKWLLNLEVLIFC